MKSRAHVRVDALARRFGYRQTTPVARPSRQAGFVNEQGEHIGRLCRARGVTHVLDVGANVGQFALSMRGDAGFVGRLDSFEPVATTYVELSRAMADDALWRGHRVAVGDRTGEVEINLYPESVFNSIHGTTEEGRQAFGAFTETAFERRGVDLAPLIRLDDAALPDIGPIFLKIDTQGHDWPVLLGATEILRRVEVLSVELSLVAMYEGSTAMAETITRLGAMGWQLAGFYPVCTTSDPLLIGEADGLFLRGPIRGLTEASSRHPVQRR